MTELEQAVASALRLTDDAANALLTEIKRNIKAAGAELIRSGCNSESVEKIVKGSNDDVDMGSLIEDAIIMYCLIRMGDETMRDKYEDSFKYQQDNLRKS